MPADRSDAPPILQTALKCLVLVLLVAVVGLPINSRLFYFVLAFSVVALAVGRVTFQWKSWIAVVAVAIVTIVLKLAIGSPRIEEGHNVFLPIGPNNALITGLPPDVFQAMAVAFDRAHPKDTWCDEKQAGCWRAAGRPRRVYAFSFDGIYDKPMFSRRVSGIDFTDPVWQRLGFVNELAYNWYGDSNFTRATRERGLRTLLHPWRTDIPYFVVYQFPADFIGSQLCWRGAVLWEGTNGGFASEPHEAMTCRTLEPGDIGKRIFGVAISPDAPLAMRLKPTLAVRIRQIAMPVLVLTAMVLLLVLLVRLESWSLKLPLTLGAFALLVVFLHDASFIGGVRPFDGGDDGIIYDGWSRLIGQHLLNGEIASASRGGEDVFYFTPGIRYLRTLEHMIFGETYFGALALILLLPFLVFALFRRFFSERAAIAMTVIFIAIPIGALFGSTFFQYVKWSARGFSDPTAAIFFLAGLILLIGRARSGPGNRFAPALGAGFFFACALFIRPNLALGGAVLLGGAGLAALWHSQFSRLAGLCVGFAPVFSAALHNWYFGSVFVLFSGHLTLAGAMPMPPSAYLAALGELVRFDFSGSNLTNAVFQIGQMLTGPSESFLMIPLHAVALIVVVRVMASGRYEGWLRLIAGATLGLHAVALFFIFAGRYHYLGWLLTLLVCSVWAKEEGIAWVRSRMPRVAAAVENSSATLVLMRALDWGERAVGRRA